MLLAFIEVTYALAQNGGATSAAQPQGPSAFIFLILLFAIFYFFFIRPQQKREKEHQHFLKDLKTNDIVVTAGGIHGRLVKVDETNIVVIEIADKVRVKFSKNQILGFSETGKKPEKQENSERQESAEKN